MRILALLVVTNFLSIIPFNSLEKIRFCVFQGVQNLKSNMKWINLSILDLKTFKYQIPKEVIQDFFSTYFVNLYDGQNWSLKYYFKAYQAIHLI